MKKNILKYYIPVLLCTMALFTSCDKEEDVHSELEPPRFDVSDNPSDPVQHARYELFANYKTYLITNPQTYDYKFNFQHKNNLSITPPPQDSKFLQKAVERLEEMFLNIYSQDFKKKYMPYSIILANEILFLGQEDATPSYDAYAANRFLAMAGFCNDMDNQSDSLKQSIKGEVHSRFWYDYMGNELNLFTIPDEFENPSEEYYSKEVSDLADSPIGDVYGSLPWEIDVHPLGFVSYDFRNTFFDTDPDYGGWWIEMPGKESDKRQWISFVFGVPKADRDKIINSYPIMKEKYDILKTAFLPFGIDLDKLP